MHRCITRIKEKVGFYWVFGLLAKRVESKMKYKEFQQLIDYGRKKNLLVMPNSKFVRSKSNYVWGNIFACFCLALFVSCNKSILHFRLAILIWYSYLNFQWRSMVLILLFFCRSSYRRIMLLLPTISRRIRYAELSECWSRYPV